MSNSVDLSQLAVERSPAAGPAPAGASRRWFSRYVLPLGIVLGFTGLLTWAMRDSLLPAQPVTIVPVMVARAEVQQSGTPLFQAAGWVEPSPVPTVVSSLAEGVIEELNVVAGQSVKKGETIARLIDVDARIALREAEAEVDIREADVDAAKAEMASAQVALDNPITLRAALAASDSSLAELEAELDSLPAAIVAAQTRQRLAEENVQSKESAGDAIAGRIRRDAKAQLASATATIDTLLARQPVLERQKEALKRRRDAIAEQLELKLEPRRRLTDAQAQLKAAEARLARAELAVETAQLQLDRTTVKSPINGRVLSIQASPGKRVNGLDPYSEQGSSAVATLYDPQMLQVRVDVRLEDVPQVQLGQTVQIETASAPAGLQGKVISVTSQADIQKNTLQVKAAIAAPPDVIRPEMLAQVTFLAPERPEALSDESTEKQRLLVPRQLVDGGESSAQIWVVDHQTKTAVRKSITLGKAGTADLVEVASGLNPTDKLISSGREGLNNGTRIRVTAEDSSMGIGGGFGTAVPTTTRTAQQPSTTKTN